MPRLWSSLLFLVLSCRWAGAEIYFQDPEAEKPLTLFAKAPGLTCQVNECSRVSLPDRPGHFATRLDLTLNGPGYCYFAIPFQVPLEPGKTYYASGHLRVEQFPFNGGKRVGLGYDYIGNKGEGAGRETSGCAFFGYATGLSAQPVSMESVELGKTIPADVEVSGHPCDSLVLDHLVIGFTGDNFVHNRIVVYLDDPTISSDLQRAPPAAREVKPFTNPDKIFPFGLWGWAGGYAPLDPSAWYGEKFPEPFWRAIPAWKEHWVNTLIGEGGAVYADSPPAAFDNLAQVSGIFEANGLYNIPRVYLTPYYRPDLTEQQCEDAIRTHIPALEHSPAILAWYLIDEPGVSWPELNDFLTYQKVFQAVDPNHPMITGGNRYNPLFEPRRAISLFDWYPIGKTRMPESTATVTCLVDQDAAGPVWCIIQAFNNDQVFSGGFAKPTPAELGMMSYAALANGAKGLFFFTWRLRPTWQLGSEIGVVDALETGSDLWSKIGKLGQDIVPIGPLLSTTQPVQPPPVIVNCEEVKNIWGVARGAIQAGVLRDAALGVEYLVAYNSDPLHAQSGTLLPTSHAHAYDLYSLLPVPGKGPIAVTLPAGEGRIYLLSDDAHFAWTRGEIEKSRVRHAREELRYDIYFAKLSGLAPPSLLKHAAKAATLGDIGAVRAELEAERSNHPGYLAMGAQLDAAQANLSGLNGLYVEKIRSAKAAPSYRKRDFDGAQPVIAAHTEALRRLIGIYFTEKNLYLKGQYEKLGPDASTLSEWTGRLKREATTVLANKGPLVAPDLNTSALDEMADRLKNWDQSLGLPYPQPAQLYALP